MVIGLVGKAGSGKSETARYVSLRHDFRRTGFADAIKQQLYNMGLFNWNDLWVKKTKDSRRAMQEFGEWVRKYDFNYWNDKCMETIETLSVAGHRDIVIDDVRRVGEAEMIRLLKGKLVRIYRGELEEITDYSHISEVEMDDIICDYEIRNNEDLESLYQKMEVIYIKMGGMKCHS